MMNRLSYRPYEPFENSAVDAMKNVHVSIHNAANASTVVLFQREVVDPMKIVDDDPVNPSTVVLFVSCRQPF